MYYSKMLANEITTDVYYSTTTESPNEPGDIPKELIELAICIAIPVISGALVAASIQTNIEWYNKIKKPDWAPPTWLFGPVWIVLYTLIGFASFLVIRAEGGVPEAAVPLLIYFANLFINLAWSPIFFGMERIKVALVDIVLVDITAVATALIFYDSSKLAGYLLIPYLIWLVIATGLNYSIYILNPDSTVNNALRNTQCQCGMNSQNKSVPTVIPTQINSVYPQVLSLSSAPASSA